MLRELIKELTKRTFKISKENVKFGSDFITSTFSYIGVRRYGKSHTVGVIEEELANMLKFSEQHKADNSQSFKEVDEEITDGEKNSHGEKGWPFIVIDPMGIHFVLREKFDNILIVGGEHGDYSLDELSWLLPLILEKRIITGFDLSELILEEQQEWVYDICEYIKYNNLRDPLHIFIEESDLFIPQSKSPKCKGMISLLIRKGGQDGIGMSIITQRLASVDKNVIAQIDNHFIFHTEWPSDITLVKKLGNISKEDIEKVKTLPKGVCYLSSHIYKGFLHIKQRKVTHYGLTPSLETPLPTINLLPLNISHLKPKSPSIINKYSITMVASLTFFGLLSYLF